jgi:putative SOS response-associated peptidase YedK
MLTFILNFTSMCGRYSFAVEDALIKERFGVSVRTAIYKARYNCAPSQDLAVIQGTDPLSLAFFRWGLIPSWAKDPAIGNRLINARAETIEEKPSFRSAFRSRRCLVPADGFFEWKKDREKTPYRIVMKDRQPFAMAGIWERWTAPDGEIVHSFSILTTGPNALMAAIHDRMPVILHPEEETLWLGQTEPARLKELLRPFPAEKMEAYPVSKLVNAPVNDRAEVLEPAGYPSLF